MNDLFLKYSLVRKYISLYQPAQEPWLPRASTNRIVLPQRRRQRCVPVQYESCQWAMCVVRMQLVGAIGAHDSPSRFSTSHYYRGNKAQTAFSSLGHVMCLYVLLPSSGWPWTARKQYSRFVHISFSLSFSLPLSLSLSFSSFVTLTLVSSVFSPDCFKINKICSISPLLPC